MVLTLFVGAAVRAATPEQRHAFEAPVKAAMQKYKETGDGRDIKTAIEDVMGPMQEWILEEDAAYIARLGEGFDR
jgi:hypothetical protein